MEMKREIGGLRQMLAAREVSAPLVTEYYLNQIMVHDPKLHSFITVAQDAARAEALRAQTQIERGDIRMWTGIPIAVSDNICTKGIPTTCGSRMLEGYIPPYDATVVRKLRGYGAIILGKTNLDEFSVGDCGATSYYGVTRNPKNPGRIAGGSCAGAAAAVAAGFCVASLGSDTGGSVREAAAYCGVTGIKPTYGCVSRYGLVAVASGLDQIGFIANSARDCGILLDSITDYDPNDTTMSEPNCFNYCGNMGNGLAGMRIGLPQEFFAAADSEVAQAVRAAAERLQELGAQLVPVSLPSFDYAETAYYILASAQAAANFARFDGTRYGYRAPGKGSYAEMATATRNEGFGPALRQTIWFGTYLLTSEGYEGYYRKALQIQKQLQAEHAAAFAQCDCLLHPTNARVARRLEEEPESPFGGACTVPASLAGLPSVTTTCGMDGNGVPIGCSITGRAFDETTILAVADAFEKVYAKGEDGR